MDFKIDFKIRTTYSVENAHEFSVDSNGYSFLIIYGRHINGWFISIPNWSFSTEAASPADAFYNTEKLRMSDIEGIRDAADSLAYAIRFHYEAMKDK